MDRLEESQIAYTICELIEQIRLLLEERYSEEFKEINSRIITDINDQLDRLFSS